MSCPNFKFMDYDLPLIIKDDETDYFEMIEMLEDAEELAKGFSENLNYFEIGVESGYYSGFQFCVYEKYDCYYDERLDNDDAHYYFDCCRSVARRKIQSELNKIHKWLKSLKDYGYSELCCIGVFSNGEAVYEYVK